MSNYGYNNKKNKTNYRSLLDQNYNFEEAYFFKDVTSEEWKKIESIVKSYYEDGTADVQILDKLDEFKRLDKGETNVNKLKELIKKYEDLNSSHKNILNLCRNMNEYLVKEYYTYNPTVFQCLFFPDKTSENERIIANMLRTCKKSLDIAIFSLSNNTLYEAVKEVWEAGCEVRIIADDECCNNFGSDIYRLAAMGIPVKTDNSKQFHMHHKFAIIDKAVVVTGSFNWTSQAVLNNQENILFFENKGLAQQYTDEYNKLFKSFEVEITPEKAKALMAKMKEDN